MKSVLNRLSLNAPNDSQYMANSPSSEEQFIYTSFIMNGFGLPTSELRELTVKELQEQLKRIKKQHSKVQHEIDENKKNEPSLIISNVTSVSGTIATIAGTILLSQIPIIGWSILAVSVLVAATGLAFSVYKLFSDTTRQDNLSILEAQKMKLAEAIKSKISEIQTKVNQQATDEIQFTSRKP